MSRSIELTNLPTNLLRLLALGCLKEGPQSVVEAAVEELTDRLVMLKPKPQKEKNDG